MANRTRARIAKELSPRLAGVIERKVRRQADASTKELAQLGKQYAISIAPMDTGRLVSLIKVLKNDGDGFYSVRAVDPIPGAPSSYHGSSRIANFRLVRWMHTSPNARYHIKSGSRTFMYDTRDYLRRIKKAKVTGRFKNINLR